MHADSCTSTLYIYCTSTNYPRSLLHSLFLSVQQKERLERSWSIHFVFVLYINSETSSGVFPFHYVILIPSHFLLVSFRCSTSPIELLGMTSPGSLHLLGARLNLAHLLEASKQDLVRLLGKPEKKKASSTLDF